LLNSTTYGTRITADKNQFKEKQTDFFVETRFPLTIRVEVETDLKLAPPMLPIPPIEEEKVVKSAVDKKIIIQLLRI